MHNPIDADAAKIKRERNTKSSTDVLIHKGIKFEFKNNGTHLAIKHLDQLIDFWPATGLWKVRNTPKESRGVFKLLKYMGVK